MKRLRYLIGIVLALGITAAAAPAYAQKQYTLDIESLTTGTQNVPSGAPVKLRATFTNTSPQGGANSSFNALQLKSPYTITNVTSVSRTEGVVTPPLNRPASTNLVKVEGLTSVGKGQKVVIEFEATIPENCVTSTWNPNATGDVWSGSQIGSGQSFTLQDPPSKRKTSTYFDDAQSIEFFKPPTSIAANVAFDLTVTQKKSCALTSFAPVVLTGPAGFTAGTPPTVTETSTEQTTTFAANKTTSTTSPQTLTATAGNLSVPWQLTVYADGVINCDTPLPITVTSPVVGNKPLEPGYAYSKRQKWNSTGTACELVPYDFVNGILVNNSVALKWPQDGAQKGAVFRTSANSALKTLSDGSTTYPVVAQPIYGWELDLTSIPLTPGLMCLDSTPPTPYAQLAAKLLANAEAGDTFDVKFGDATIVYRTLPQPTPVAGGGSPSYEFDFNIDNERIRGKVTAINNTAKTATITIVSRGRGSTTPEEHAADRYLISVVMPIDGRVTTHVYYLKDSGLEVPSSMSSNPYQNKVVRMCTIAHGIQMYTPSASGQSQYFEFLEYYDGDGVGSFR